MDLESANSSLGWLLDHAGLCAFVLARVLGVCLTAPPLAIPELDWRFRLGLTAVLSAVLIPVVEPTMNTVADSSNPGLTVIVELLTGGVLGCSVALIIAGARLGGEIVAAQAGLLTATLLDADTGEEQTPLGRLYAWIALAAFLALDGPLAVIQALAESYHAVPAGRSLVVRATTEQAFAQLGHALELALRVAAPPALALVLAGIVLGWLSRAGPSIPFVALALPIRSFLGVALVVMSLAALIATLSGAWKAPPWGG
jgi:flagellar biosynthetic protein FliR